MIHFKINSFVIIVVMCNFFCNIPNNNKIEKNPIFNFKDVKLTFYPTYSNDQDIEYGQITFNLSHNFSAPLYINHQSILRSGHHSVIGWYCLLDEKNREVSKFIDLVNCGDIWMSRERDTLDVGESHKYKLDVSFFTNRPYPKTHNKHQYTFFSCPLDFVTTDSIMILSKDRRFFDVIENKNGNCYFSAIFRFYFDFEKQEFRQLTSNEVIDIFEGEKKYKVNESLD